MPEPAIAAPRIARVLVVEDSQAWQELLTSMLETVPSVSLVSVVESPHAAIQAISDLDPDILVLDWELREGSGLEVLQTVKSGTSRCEVIVFSMSDTTQDRQHYAAKGADGFASKNEAPERLLQMLVASAAKRSCPARLA